MRFYRTPYLVKVFFNGYTWQRPGDDKVIHLTFDDGPIPRLTEYICSVLSDYNAKATFFCVGENLHKHPSAAAGLLKRGHVIGNHTYHHLKAWKAKTSTYLNDIKMFEDEFCGKFEAPSYSWLFRPPHGQIKPGLARAIVKMGYEIIMWDTLSYDFDGRINPATALEKLKTKTLPGSIVVFHDNYKAESNLKQLLPAFLSHFASRGFRFEILKNKNIENKNRIG